MTPKILSSLVRPDYIPQPAVNSDESDRWSAISRDTLDSDARDGIIYDDPPPCFPAPAPSRPKSHTSEGSTLRDWEELPEFPDEHEILGASDESSNFDFEGIALADAKQSISNGPLPPTWGETALALAKRVQEVGGSTKRVTVAGFNALYEEVLDSSPLDPRLWHPGRWLLTLATGLATAGAVELFGEYQGDKSVDHQATIDRARRYLEEGRGAFSRDQTNTIQRWLQEAELELERFICKQHKSVGPRAEPSPPVAEKKAESSVEGRSERETPPAAPVVASSPEPSHAKGTFGAHMHSLRRAADRRNPNLELLKTEAPELATVLQALQNFLTVPYRIQQTSPTRVDENSRTNPALGNSKFVANLEDRAKSLAEDAFKPANEQNKRLLIAASGPGTGKTTSIQKMAEWAELPLCMLTGEAFKRMKIPAGSTAFAVFQRWVCEKVLRDFRIDDRGVVNGILLLDDFHFAWEFGGPFDASTGSASRNQFFLFLKNMGDANQDSIFSVELAPNREFPLNLSRVQVIITLNSVPPELGSKAQPALRSRMVDLQPDYPTREDRRRIAIENRLPEIKRAVLKLAKKGSVDRIDEELARESIGAVADADAALIAEKFNGKHGYRGLFELLDRYKAHVLRKLEATEGEIVPTLFSLKNGATPFEPREAMNAIQDYQCAVDSNMAEVEARAKNEAERNSLRGAVTSLRSRQRQIMLARIQANGAITNKTAAEADLADIKQRLRIYAQMPDLLSAEEIGRNITKKFGYFKATAAAAAGSVGPNDVQHPADASSETTASEGEVDRWGPLEHVLSTLYWRRAYARGDGDPETNQPVRVTFTSPDAFDDGLFPGIAEVLGGLPICRVLEPHQLIAFEDPYGVTAQHPSFKAMKELVDNESLVTDSVSGNSVYFRDLSQGSRHYFYFTDGYDKVLLNNRGLDEALKASREGHSLDGHSGIGKRMNSRASISSDLAELLKPQLSLFDSVLSQAARTPELSPGESLVVVLLDSYMRTRIGDWAAFQTNPSRASPITLFENFLAEKLNEAEVKLRSGGTFDPRALSVFLLNEPRLPVGESTAVMNWKLGVPPIEGRSVRARDRLNDKMRDMCVVRCEQLKALGQAFDAESMKLTHDEQRVVQQLIGYDRKVALEARREGYTLPNAPLDESVDDLAKRLKAIKINTFKTEQNFPDLTTFRNAWAEYYSDARAAIEWRRTEKVRQAAAAERAKVEQAAAVKAALEAPAKAPKAPKARPSSTGRGKGKPGKAATGRLSTGVVVEVPGPSSDDSEGDEAAVVHKV